MELEKLYNKLSHTLTYDYNKRPKSIFALYRRLKSKRKLYTHYLSDKDVELFLNNYSAIEKIDRDYNFKRRKALLELFEVLDRNKVSKDTLPRDVNEIYQYKDYFIALDLPKEITIPKQLNYIRLNSLSLGKFGSATLDLTGIKFVRQLDIMHSNVIKVCGVIKQDFGFLNICENKKVEDISIHSKHSTIDSVKIFANPNLKDIDFNVYCHSVEIWDCSKLAKISNVQTDFLDINFYTVRPKAEIEFKNVVAKRINFTHKGKGKYLKNIGNIKGVEEIYSLKSELLSYIKNTAGIKKIIITELNDRFPKGILRFSDLEELKFNGRNIKVDKVIKYIGSMKKLKKVEIRGQRIILEKIDLGWEVIER